MTAARLKFRGWTRPDGADRIAALTIKGFKEDDDMISAVQQMIERDPRSVGYPEVMVATDRSAVQARRLLQKQLAAENNPAAAEPTPGQ